MKDRGWHLTMEQKLGFVSLILGLVVIFGWITKAPMLIQIHKSFVPMQFNTALCFFISGLLYTLNPFSHKRAYIFLTSTLFMISSISLLQYVFDFNSGLDELFFDHFITIKSEFPGRMSPATATCFLFTSLIFYSAFAPETCIKKCQFFRSFFSSLVLSASIGSLSGYAMGIESNFAWEVSTRMAVHTTVGFIFLSLAGIFRSNFFSLKYNYAITTAFLTIFLGNILSFNFGKLLHESEKNEEKAAIASEAKIFESKVILVIRERVKAFERLSKRMTYSGRLNKKLWSKDAKEYYTDFKYYRSIEFSDANHITKWVYPETEDDAVLNLNIGPNSQILMDIEEAKNEKGFVLSHPINLGKDGMGALMIHPVYNEDKYLGNTIGVISFKAFFDSLIKDIQDPSFDLLVKQGNKILYPTLNHEVKFFSQEVLSDIIPGMNLKLSIVNKNNLFLNQHSFIGEIVLIFGSLLSIFLGFSFYFYLKLAENVKTLEGTQEDLIKAKDDAKEALKIKTSFLANMSHEIRTPMNAILGMTEVLQIEVKKSEQKNKLKIIKDSSENLLEIINNILDLTKLEASKVETEKINFNIHDLLKDKIKLFTPLASKKKLTVIQEINEDVPKWVISDPSRLTQVLNNLLSNAIKFTHEGYIKVSVGATRIEGNKINLSFSIRDTGIGIRDDNIDKLFKDFSQVDSSTSRLFGGTGLGLSICRKTIAVLGGKIGAQSKFQEGTIFKFSVPVLEGTQEKENNFDAIEDKLNFQKDLKILSVEDNLVNQTVLKFFLERLNLRSDFAENGYEALEILEKSQYDLIFMDCHMPLMDGFETTSEIIERFAKNIPVIVAVTASTFEEDIERCYASGMDDFISKPINIQEIKRVLNKHFPGQEILNFDESMLLDAFEQNEELMLEASSLLLENIDEMFEEIKSSFVRNSARELEMAAHKLKGALCNFQFNDEVQTCQLIEDSARNQNLSDIEKQVDHLENGVNKIKTILNSELLKKAS